MEVDSSLDDADVRNSDMSQVSVKKYFLNEKGVFKSKKTNFVMIDNKSKFDLIVVVEFDYLAPQLADGGKIDKERDGIPAVHTVAAGKSATVEIKTKISYITVLRKHPTSPGYFMIRNKKYLKRSSKWTATTASVEKCNDAFCEESYLLNFTGPTTSNRPNPVSLVRGGNTMSVDDEPRIPEKLREQLLKEQQHKNPVHSNHKDEEGDGHSVEEDAIHDGVSSSSGGQTNHLVEGANGKKKGGRSCCCCCVC